jgi:hypothetical protein
MMEHAVHSLPTANVETTRFFHQWLETFSGFVREVDYAAARPLFHPAGRSGASNKQKLS